MGITRDPDKDYFEAYKRSIEDWVEDDDWIRDTAKLVLTDSYVEGDSYGVPGHSTIVTFLTAYIHVLTDKTPPEGERWQDLRWEIHRIKTRPEDLLVKIDRPPSDDMRFDGTLDSVYNILKRFVDDCVEGADFDTPGSDARHTLKTWWNKNKHKLK